MANELFVLAEVDNHNAVFAPLKSAHRIKYTCFSVSRNFLIFGATSGGLYVFRREPCIFLQLLPNKDGSVTQVSVSPDEKFFAFSTMKGVVCLVERSQSLKVRRIQMSVEHHGSEVTAMQWNLCSSELFVGDGSGKISVVSASAFVAKNMFQAPFFTLMQLDSRIVQLDSCSDLLLVSTLSRCYICETVKEQYCQIGHKLREGEYGACFYAAGEQCDVSLGYQQQGATMGTACTSLLEGQKLANCEGLQNLKMFCARPGSRLWEVRIDGTVLSTHHFKQALAVPPTGITRTHDMLQGGNVKETSQSETWGQQSFNFTKLYIIAKKFLFTFKRDGVCVLDPEKGKVVLWNNSFRDIVDAKTLNDIMYIWTSSGHIHAVMMLPVDRFLVGLYLRKQYGLCAQLCEQHNNYLMELAQTSSKLQLLADLGTKLENNEVAKKISPLLQEIGKHAEEKQNAHRLKSGIFLVRNMQSLHSKVEEGQDISLQSCPCVRTPIEKSRSLTASPENNRKKKSEGCQKNWKSVSTTSLPELVHHLNGTGIFKEDGTQFHKELCALDVLSNSEGNILVSQTNSELKSIITSDTHPTFPPEALQTLKEMRRSVLWKSLREKWQVLEGKMKLLGQDITFEPLAITTVDYQEAVLEEELSNEDAELVYSSSDKLRTGLYFPVLDVSNVVDLCVRLITHEQNGGNKPELIYEFLNAISNIHQLYVTEIRTHCSMADDTAQTSNLRSELNMVHSFPFAHYFTDDIITVIRDKFHFALQTRYLITWLQDKIQDVPHTEQFPEHFKCMYSEDTLKLDVLLSKVLVIYSGLLDPIPTLRYLQTSNLRCYYLSLCVILDRYEEGNLSSKSEYVSEHATYDELPPPLLLSTIFFMFSVECVANCCKFSKQVSVKDVWYLVMRLQQHLEGTGRKTDAVRSHCYTLFLSYLEKIPERNDCLSEVFADDQLRLYVATAFEELNSVTSGVCDCGFPVLIPPTLCHSDLAEFIVLYYWENNQGYLIELCKKVPSLWYLVLRQRRNEGFSSVLPLIIHLGDTLELANWLSYMDHAAWVQTLDLLTTFQSGTCLNCGSVFTTFGDKLGGVLWSSFGLLLVKALGPHEGVRLLTKYASHIKSGDLDTRFFQACICSAIIDNHSQGLRNAVIDSLNVYTKKATETSLFSPVVGPAVEEALKEDLGKQVGFTVASEKHHWGVKMNMVDGNCPCCALPLGSPILMKDGGVNSFCCGHSYHVVCLKRQVQHYICPICTKSS